MKAVSRHPLAISKNEFLQMFRKCVPPGGWSENIGVANSGGPDSTCLLFLIHRYLTEQTPSADIPHRVVSMTVDHSLQASSSSMAEHCSRVAQSMGVEHTTSRIPWSEDPFPPRPLFGEAFESIARTARYHLLLQALKRADANVLAFGHHADDQVETSLMRLGRGTTEIGAGGMRPCRRWGMGMGRGEGKLGWAGHEGMSKWIIRPLLDVSKDRILATCEENNLDYLTDSTNFQPHVTLRNAIRQVLTVSDGKPLTGSKITKLPRDIGEKLTAIDKAVSSLQNVSVDLSSGTEQLRGAVQFLSSQVEDIDSQVDSALKRCNLPSPPGTYLLSSRGLAGVRDDMTRTGLVLRVMRYASFHPWGSVRADGNRRRTSLDQIKDKLWNPDPFAAGIKMFVAGGGILWTPVVVRNNNIKTPDRIRQNGIRAGENFAWLASRQPPLNRERMKEIGIENPLQRDITGALAEGIAKGDEILEILWDCRFVVRFNFSRIPRDIVAAITSPSEDEKIVIHPQTRWYWPRVVRERGEVSQLLHSEVEDTTSKSLLDGHQEEEDHTIYWKPREKGLSADWIDVRWIRSLGSL